jgi:hypothetical protein
MFDGTIVKIVSSKELAQKIVSYFVTNTWALVEQYYSHRSKTWCCPMPQNFLSVFEQMSMDGWNQTNRWWRMSDKTMMDIEWNDATVRRNGAVVERNKTTVWRNEIAIWWNETTVGLNWIAIGWNETVVERNEIVVRRNEISIIWIQRKIGGRSMRNRRMSNESQTKIKWMSDEN